MRPIRIVAPRLQPVSPQDAWRGDGAGPGTQFHRQCCVIVHSFHFHSKNNCCEIALELTDGQNLKSPWLRQPATTSRQRTAQLSEISPRAATSRAAPAPLKGVLSYCLDLDNQRERQLAWRFYGR